MALARKACARARRTHRIECAMIDLQGTMLSRPSPPTFRPHLRFRHAAGGGSPVRLSQSRLMGTRTYAPRRRSFPRLHSLSDYSLASNEEQRVIPVPGAAPSRQTLLPCPAGLLPSRPVVPQSASQPGIKTPNSSRRRHGVRTREERKFVSLIHPFHATSRQAVA